MREIELKFRLDDRTARSLRSRIAALPGLDGPPVTKLLRSVYHDTPDQALRKAGIALRMRRDGRRWVQTVKARTTRHGALQSALEAEITVPAGRLNLNLIPDESLRTLVGDIARDRELSPVCETAIRRSTCILRAPDGIVAEIALDRGEIIAGDRARGLCELEIELKSGSLAALFDIAQTLLPEGGLSFSRLSKAARGYLLAETGEIEPPLTQRKALSVHLKPGQSSETAARGVLRECFEQVAWNVETIRSSDDPEGPHQLRIGLRRLRSAFAVFKPVLRNAEMARLNDEARWLGQEVGIQRDLDVAITDLLMPEAAAHPDEPGFQVLIRALRDRADSHREVLHTVLESARTQAFLFDLARFVEARGWLAPDDIDQTARLARPVSEFAAESLNRTWARTCKRARRIETLDIEGRHELRKQLKKLRYAVEFFAPVLPKKQVKPFLKRLKALHDLFGELNDAAMVDRMFCVDDAPAAGDPDAQRAAGRLLGSRTARADHHWSDAKALWSQLAASRRCW